MIKYSIIILFIALTPAYASCCDLHLDCKNVTYIYVDKLPDMPGEFGSSPGKYAIMVFLTKKQFNFTELSKMCSDSLVAIHSPDALLDKQQFQNISEGAFIFYRNSLVEAFSTARSICAEKTDPDLRR